MFEIRKVKTRKVIIEAGLVLFFCLFELQALFAAETTPPTGSIKINNNAPYTNSVDVILNLSAKDSGSGVNQMQFSNDSSIWSTPELYATTKSWILTAGAEAKRVYARYKDNAGNWSNSYSDSIIFDNLAPIGAIKINNGTVATNSITVTLKLSASDSPAGLSQMQFSNDNSIWSAPESYKSTKTWEIPAGDGNKTVCVKFSDKAGNWSLVYSDTIILDTLLPVISNVVNSSIAAKNAKVSWVTDEAATSQVEYGLTGSYGSKTGVAKAFVTTHAMSISGLQEYSLYHFRVISKDVAGNQAISSDYTFNTLDSSAPIGSIIINNGDAETSSTNATLSLAAIDTASGVTEMKFSNNNSTWSTSESYANTKTWILSTGLGIKKVYVKFKDNSGNWSKAYSDSITLVRSTDVTPPTGTIKINNDNSFATVTSVTLNLLAQDGAGGSGISQMQFSNDNFIWLPPESYATTKAWILTTGDGIKTVYVKYRDSAGNWSNAISDAIMLDTTPPEINIVSPLDNEVIGAEEAK